MLLTPKRTGFKIAIAPTDKELWAVGLVVVEWSLLETEIDAWARVANGDMFFRKEDGGPYGFKEVARFIKAQAELQAVEPFKSELINAVVSILGIQAERDKIVHWAWNRYPLEPIVVDSGHTTVSAIKGGGGAWDHWKVTASKLVDVARRIDGARARMHEIAITCRRQGDEPYTLGHAWRRICGTPST